MLTCNQLAQVGFKVDDTWMCSLLLKGLPKRYDPMILGLESSGVALTADMVKAKTMQDVKVTSGSKSSENDAWTLCVGVPSEKKKEKCGTQKEHAAYFAAQAVQSTERNDSDWFFDSGATTHLCRNKKMLENPLDMSARIKVANNAEVAVVAKGSVKLEADCGETTWDLTMSDVLCVPDLAINFLSVSKRVAYTVNVMARFQRQAMDGAHSPPLPSTASKSAIHSNHAAATQQPALFDGD
ncbi:uncharacterized protein LOC134288243 [Aedes albopictus]|uniref:Retrovirus-related Pol polyprotein from transposon TNT 1-94-like beta-barrel domain-containing protein n=1 Tax=Aedes albopictus TaxID=7160 RepID=A0ABM1ZY90_AEDAL